MPMLRLERADIAAFRRERIGSQRQVGDLAGSAVSTSDQPAVDQDAHANSGPEHDEDEVPAADPASLPLLANGTEVHVVLDQGCLAQDLGEAADHVETINPGRLGASSMAPVER